MASERPVDHLLIVFACISCGTLLSVGNNNANNSKICENCGALYESNVGLGSDSLFRVREGRPPSQWASNGYNETKEAK